MKKPLSETLIMNHLLLTGLLQIALDAGVPVQTLFTPEQQESLETVVNSFDLNDREAINHTMIILVRTIREIGERIIGEADGTQGFVIIPPDAEGGGQLQ